MKIVIISDNYTKAMFLKNMLIKENSFQVLCCSDSSREELESILNYQPDIILYTPCIKYEDGINLIQEIRSAGYSGKIVLMMENTLPAALNLALNFSSDYVMFYPLDTYSIISYVKELNNKDTINTNASVNSNESTFLIQKTLNQLGISQHLNGYKYLVQAIKLCYDNPEMLNYKTKFLYPELGKINNINVTNIERCIRNAIQKAWENQNHKNFLSIINPSFERSDKRPTCSAVIEAVTAYVSECTGKENCFV